MSKRHYMGKEGRAVIIIQELYKQSMYGLPGLTAHAIAVNCGWTPGKYIRDACEWAESVGLIYSEPVQHTGKRVAKVYFLHDIQEYDARFPNVSKILRRKFGVQLKLFEDLEKVS